MNLITDDVRALIGVESEPRTAKVPLSEEMLRRFVHGVMEENTVHCDPDVARKSRYGQLVAPPLFPIHAFRRSPDTPDPLDALREDPFDDGTFVGEEGSFGLPAVRLPLRRRLNGGTEAELFQMGKIGDVITARSKYVDIQEKTGREGNPMVITKIATSYTNQDGDLLAIITISMISR